MKQRVWAYFVPQIGKSLQKRDKTKGLGVAFLLLAKSAKPLMKHRLFALSHFADFAVLKPL